MAEQKAYQASKRKLEKARKEGNVLKSQTLSQGLGLILASSTAVLLLHLVWVKKQKLIKYCFINSSLLPQQCAAEALKLTSGVVVAILFIAAVCGVTMELAQVGFKIEASLLAPKSERLDIGVGWKRIFTGIKNIWKTLLQYVLLVLVLTWCLFELNHRLLIQLLNWQADSSKSLVWPIVAFLLIAGVAFLVAGVIDYVVQRREYFAQLSMSHDEVFREHKDSEGDPMLKGMRRQIHEELISQDVVERIKEAKVIVVERS